MRLDLYLVQKFNYTRSRASLLIKESDVFVNGDVATKSSYKVKENDFVEVKDSIGYVSRAALKLKKAIENFKIDVSGLDAIDVGSSTGGFTEVLLENNIRSVDCVDVGTNQLHEKIRGDERVRIFENTDIRDFESNKEYDLIVLDTSFISQTKFIEKFSQFSKKGTLVISLIKPQFEVGKNGVDKKGIVISDELAQESIDNVIDFYLKNNWKQLGEVIDSPILGKAGNKEYIAVFQKN